MKKIPSTRRDFIKATVLTGAATVSGLRGLSAFAADKADGQKYGNALQDRLWMWGHESETIQGGHYAVPIGKPILQADAVDSMGIPNNCVIRYLGAPAPPFDEYVKQFKKTKRVAWSIIDGAPQPFEWKKKAAFALIDKMPNLTTLFLDDYFKGDAVPKETKEGTIESPADLTVSGIKKLHAEVAALERPIDLAVVVYSNQLNPGIAKHIAFCDVVSFWTWKATDLVNLKDNFARYRKIVPSKRTLLGIYMWDFGNKKPVSLELMKIQCDFALKAFKSGQIEGMIFHCTPLVGAKLEAVDYARRWISQFGSTTR
jgi:hypothetical protein